MLRIIFRKPIGEHHENFGWLDQLLRVYIMVFINQCKKRNALHFVEVLLEKSVGTGMFSKYFVSPLK
jgi:hypothetical protein